MTKRRDAYWRPIGDEDDDVLFECSECEGTVSTNWDYDDDFGRYCPYCGARMVAKSICEEESKGGEEHERTM